MQRYIAIDWSGALDLGAQRRGIWVADSQPCGQLALRSGESRAAVEAFLLQAAAETAPLVAGIDFSFSYPASFVAELGCRSAPELWARVAAEGEQWLTAPHISFWGRAKGSCQPPNHLAPAWHGYRRTELDARSGGVLPRSSFQIGGAGAVGTGSLRGIPMLARLRQAGFSIWPFDPTRLPLLVEIYPRLLTGAVVKSSAAARAAYLAQPEFCSLPVQVRSTAEASEDAFDALVSVWRMVRHAGQFAQLPWPVDERTGLEGAIWRPAP